MNAHKFYNRVTNSKKDIILEFINLLKSEKINYCIIGGLGMNAYCEPIVTLDFDCVVAIEKFPLLHETLKQRGFKTKKHPHTIEVTSKDSALRIHIQLDKRYEEFLRDAKFRNVLGYKIRVAKKENLLLGKIWAYLDPERNKLKKEKDLLDIKRLIEKYPELRKLVPEKMELVEGL